MTPILFSPYGLEATDSQMYYNNLENIPTRYTYLYLFNMQAQPVRFCIDKAIFERLLSQLIVPIYRDIYFHSDCTLYNIHKIERGTAESATRSKIRRQLPTIHFVSPPYSILYLCVL